MTAIFAKRARLPAGWAENVVIRIEGGRVVSVEAGAKAPLASQRVDALLPAMSNLHSHSFQRAFAGMTEWRSAGRDSFWTWRDLMYRYANLIEPDEFEAIAAYGFIEMLEAGYAAVGEFHYLHHQRGGAPYDAIDEMSARVFGAAAATGIGVTLLPVLYVYGGAGKAPLAEEQKRFANDVDRFNLLVEAARSKTPGPDGAVGIAPHSLRATSPEILAQALGANRTGPVHIHAAEQPKEVEDVANWLGARPVSWLIDNCGVDERWCLVHATHMSDAESEALASSGAVAGLCPITEANLGDGAFNGKRYFAAGGRYGVGTDSNVRISLNEELRMLEYSQRLKHLERNVLAGESGHVGASLYLSAAAGGARALARDSGAIENGCFADLVAIDGSAPALCGLDGDGLIDGFVFAAGDNVVTDVWSAGRHVVSGGRHHARDKVAAAYRKTLARLTARG